jgi:hypothetical protein
VPKDDKGRSLDAEEIRTHIRTEVGKAIAGLERSEDERDDGLLKWFESSLTETQPISLKLDTRPDEAPLTGRFWTVTADTGSWYIVYDSEQDSFGLAGDVVEAMTLDDPDPTDRSDQKDPKHSSQPVDPGELVDAFGSLSTTELRGFVEAFVERFDGRATSSASPPGPTYLGSYGSLLDTIRAW